MKVKGKTFLKWILEFIIIVNLAMTYLLDKSGTEGFISYGIYPFFLMAAGLLLLRFKKPEESEKWYRFLVWILLLLVGTISITVGGLKLYRFGQDVLGGVKEYQGYPEQIITLENEADDNFHYAIITEGYTAEAFSIEENIVPYIGSTESDDLITITLWPHTGILKKIYSATAEEKVNQLLEEFGDSTASEDEAPLGGFPVFRLIIALLIAGVYFLARWSSTPDAPEQESEEMESDKTEE